MAKNSDLHNFADGNNFPVTCNNLTSLCHTLENESESSTDWLKNNNMIANLDNFWAITLSKDATDVTPKLKIYNN